MAQTKMMVKCKDCGEEFEVTEGEQAWYAERGWDIPKRCKACREVAKNKHKQTHEKS
ncbi:MAG: zinc-ribbon domain containing protein [Tannerellaceae bacterium]